MRKGKREKVKKEQKMRKWMDKGKKEGKRCSGPTQSTGWRGDNVETSCRDSDGDKSCGDGRGWVQISVHMQLFMPDPHLPSQPQSITAHWPVSNYTPLWHRHKGANNLTSRYVAMLQLRVKPVISWPQVWHPTRCATMPSFLYIWHTLNFRKLSGWSILLLLLLHPFNGLFFQDNLGKPAPER